MIQPRAQYDYAITHLEGQRFIVIEDLNRGAMSVTNDIENVVAAIEEEHRIKAEQPDFLIIYRDSEGDYDGWRKKGSFVFLNARTEEVAKKRYLELIKK